MWVCEAHGAQGSLGLWVELVQSRAVCPEYTAGSPCSGAETGTEGQRVPRADTAQDPRSPHHLSGAAATPADRNTEAAGLRFGDQGPQRASPCGGEQDWVVGFAPSCHLSEPRGQAASPLRHSEGQEVEGGKGTCVFQETKGRQAW